MFTYITIVVKLFPMQRFEWKSTKSERVFADNIETRCYSFCLSMHDTVLK